MSKTQTSNMNKSGLKPLGRAVLVKPYDVEEVTVGGIILPDMVRNKDQLAEQRAIVIEVGDAAWEDEKKPRAKPGDKIIYSKYAGYVAIGTADEEKYRVVNDRDIFIAITEEKAK